MKEVWCTIWDVAIRRKLRASRGLVHTSHLNPPSKAGQPLVFTIAQAVEAVYTHVKPIMLNVSNAYRTDSVEPLMEGAPLHEAVCRMIARNWNEITNHAETCLPK